jgi:hypothetical protein
MREEAYRSGVEARGVPSRDRRRAGMGAAPLALSGTYSEDEEAKAVLAGCSAWSALPSPKSPLLYVNTAVTSLCLAQPTNEACWEGQGQAALTHLLDRPCL